MVYNEEFYQVAVKSVKAMILALVELEFWLNLCSCLTDWSFLLLDRRSSNQEIPLTRLVSCVSAAFAPQFAANDSLLFQLK